MKKEDSWKKQKPNFFYSEISRIKMGLAKYSAFNLYKKR